MLHKKADQKPRFIVEIEPTGCSQENQKHRFLGYAEKMRPRLEERGR